jgi:hypothetical protein
MRRVTGVGVLLALGVVAGCSSAPPAPEATAAASSAIQGGSTDTAAHDFAVGLLVNVSGGAAGACLSSNVQCAICSGALLAPNLVATARHCVASLGSSTVDCATSNFGSLFATNAFFVTNAVTYSGSASSYVGVSQIVVPSGSNQTGVCGNDIALLILSKNINVAEYVTPAINPALTDHSAWATTVTAIGYGIDTPTDSPQAGGTGASAGTRRIKENIGLVCIPNDTTFVDCFSDPTVKQYMAASEFQSGDGTCEGDSGSSAFDQTQFNNGNWVSFGVLSRGGVSTDGQTCTGSVYSRFDSWSQLLIDTANQAAAAGGYSPPAWTTGGTSSGSSGSSGGSGGSSGSTSGGSSGGSGGATTGKSDGSTCGGDTECSSQNCVSLDGKNFVCASVCSATSTCASGATCTSGYCFTDGPTSLSQHSGCAVAPAGDEARGGGAPAGIAVAFAAVGAGLARRRRRASSVRSS